MRIVLFTLRYCIVVALPVVVVLQMYNKQWCAAAAYSTREHVEPNTISMRQFGDSHANECVCVLCVLGAESRSCRCWSREHSSGKHEMNK